MLFLFYKIIDNKYIFFSSGYYTRKQAETAKNKNKKMGFKGTFIVIKKHLISYI